MQVKRQISKKKTPQPSIVVPDSQQQQLAQLLPHKLKQLESKLFHQRTIIDTLKFHNEDLDRQLTQKISQVKQLKQENLVLKGEIKNLENQLQARKRSAEDIIRQLREEITGVKDKNSRMCQIVKLLQTENKQLHNHIKVRSVTGDDYKQILQQITLQNQNLKKQLVKTEVSTQKYKLKILEGQKYWSSKLELNKFKDQQLIQQKLNQLQIKHREEKIGLKADVFRFEKLLKIKDEKIRNLENKIQQMLLEEAL